MRTRFLFAALLLTAFLMTLSASGQDTAQTGSTKDQPAEGINRGNYNIRQSIEFGYRFTEPSGNARMFDTLVNVNQGLRLLDQTLSMHSLNHTGVLFDNLYISSFGWGGDPYNGARWSVSKNKIYNFTGNFRRDQNFFDYDLLANPLNPPSTTPAYPNANINESPHSMELRHRMSDMALTILPQAPISLRLGYVRNNMTGPSLSSFHEGTDVLLFQPWNTTLNGYRIGVDFKVLPKTIISYDQSLDYFKGDTDWSLAPFAVFTTSTGVPVNFGLPWNIPARQPCASPFLPVDSATANPNCSGYESYTRAHRYRMSQPTESLMLQSHAIPKLDFVVRGIYSSAEAKDALDEHMVGVVVRTGVNERAFDLVGPSAGRRLTATVEADGTYHFSDAWRALVNFRFYRFNIPGNWDSTETIFSPTTPAAIGGPIGTPVVTSELFEIFFGQNEKSLTGEIEHDFGRHFGARIGTRWTSRHINHRDFAEDAPDVTDINEYTGLLGVWFRGGNGFRANFDAEFTSADNFLTRISPRNQQRYRARVSYNPKPWAVTTVYMNFWEARNGLSEIEYRGHSRNAGVDVNIAKSERFGFDAAYNYNGFLQDGIVCFVGSFSPPGTTTPSAASPCTAAGLTSQIASDFNTQVHYFSAAFYARPVKRVTANLGYSLSRSDGDSTFFNVLQPFGGIRTTYHQPLANIAVELVKNWTWNVGYNYWNYKENDVGPTLPRNFHANVTTVSLRYAF